MTLRRSDGLLMGIPIAFALVAVCVTGMRLADAHAQRIASEARLQLTLRDASELIDLRGRQQVVGLRERPTQDVIALVNSVLAEVGLPASHLKSISPEADSVLSNSNGVSGPAFRKQSLRLVLENLSMPELGSFLVQWRQSQQAWTTTRIELTRQRAQQATTPSNYDVNLVLSAIYVAET